MAKHQEAKEGGGSSSPSYDLENPKSLKAVAAGLRKIAAMLLIMAERLDGN